MAEDRLTGLDASFLHLEDDAAHMHVAAVMTFDGPAPPHERDRRGDQQPSPPRPALPPEARLRPVRTGPAALGRRPPLQPPLPRSPHGPTGAGHRGAAQAPRRTRLLPAPRSRQAAVGDVGRRGPRRRRPLRRAVEDPPRARGRRVRHRHHEHPVRHEARARLTAAGRDQAAGCRGPTPSRRAAPRRGAVRARHRARRDRPRRPRAGPRPAPDRELGGRQPRGRRRRWSAPGSARRRRPRTTSRSARTGASPGCGCSSPT